MTGYFLTNYKKVCHHFHSISNHTESGAGQIFLRHLLYICAHCAAEFQDGIEIDTLLFLNTAGYLTTILPPNPNVFYASGTRSVGQSEVKSTKKQCPEGLMGARLNAGHVVLVSPNHKWLVCSLQLNGGARRRRDGALKQDQGTWWELLLHQSLEYQHHRWTWETDQIGPGSGAEVKRIFNLGKRLFSVWGLALTWVFDDPRKWRVKSHCHSHLIHVYHSFLRCPVDHSSDFITSLLLKVKGHSYYGSPGNS